MKTVKGLLWFVLGMVLGTVLGALVSPCKKVVRVRNHDDDEELIGA